MPVRTFPLLLFIDGVTKSPLYSVVAGREMLTIPYVCLRFRNTTTPCISNF